MSFLFQLIRNVISYYYASAQTWNSRDLSLGLATSRGSFLEVLVSVLVLKSWSWFSNPQVSVSVLVLGLETAETRSSSLMKREIETNSDTFKVLHPLLEKVFCPPATYVSVERIFSHSGLLMRANRARMADNMLSQLVYLRCNNKL